MLPKMIMLEKKGKREFIWLGLIALTDFLIIQLLVGWGNWGLDIVIRDSYIILTAGQIFFILFLNISFLVYVVKQVLNKFENLYANLILLVVVGLLIYVSSMTIKFIGSIDQGWIIYPPFSSSPVVLKEKYKITASVNVFVQFYEIAQILILSITGIMTGRNWSKHSTQHKI
jgi:hypothetical protein